MLLGCIFNQKLAEIVIFSFKKANYCNYVKLFTNFLKLFPPPGGGYTDIYRVIHVSMTFLIWLKRTLKRIEDMKERHFYSPEDPPFDMKHQLMSADSVPVAKIDLK